MGDYGNLCLYSITVDASFRNEADGNNQVYVVANEDCVFPKGGYKGVIGEAEGCLSSRDINYVTKIVIERISAIVKIEGLTLERLIEQAKKK